jgi:Lrp/AsnC family transcriptional regulator
LEFYPVNVPISVDRLDLKILGQLQDDSAQPVTKIADSVGLSSNACWRRIKRLEDEGIIRKRVALLDASKLGVGMTVFVSVRAAVHADSWLEKFAAAVAAIPEIVEFHRLSGDVDYVLKILVADVVHYDQVYKILIRSIDLADVTASFSMEQIKGTTAVPLTQG